MHKETSRSLQGLFRNMLVFPAQVVEGPHIKKITAWVDLCSARLPKGSKSIILPYWSASSVGRTGSDQREKGLNRRLVTCLPTEDHRATAFLVVCSQLALKMMLCSQMPGGVGANQSLQLQSGSKTSWDCFHVWCWDTHTSGICHWDWPLNARNQEVGH